MALPSNVSFGTVVGRFMRAVADGADPDRDPDGIPLDGLTVKFIPSNDRFKNASAVPPVTIIADQITATTNALGELVGADGQTGIKLLATDDADLQPTGWTWGVAISGNGFRTISFNMALPGGATVDLTTVVPVPGNPGQALADWVAAVDEAQSARDEAYNAIDAALSIAPTADAVALAAGSEATATLTGPPEARVLTIGVPRGERGHDAPDSIPANEAFATYVTTEGPTSVALNAAIALASGVANVRAYGAAMDGVTDDTAALQAAATAARNGDGKLLVPPGRCRITGPVDVWTSATFDGEIVIDSDTAVINFQRALAPITIPGTSLGGLVEDSVKISGLGGQLGTLLIESSERLIGRVTTGTPYYLKSEVVEVIAVDGSVSPPIDNTIVSNATVTAKLYPIEPRLIVDGLRCVPGPNITAARSVGFAAIYRSHAIFNGMEIVNTSTLGLVNGVVVRAVADLEFNGGTVDNFAATGTGYGIATYNTADVRHNNQTIVRCRHAISGRWNKRRRVNGGTYEGGIDDHWGSDLILRNVSSTVDAGGTHVLFCGKNVELYDCDLRGGRQIVGIRFDTPELDGNLIVEGGTWAPSTGNSILWAVCYSKATIDAFDYGRTIRSPKFVAIRKIRYVSPGDQSVVLVYINPVLVPNEYWQQIVVEDVTFTGTQSVTYVQGDLRPSQHVGDARGIDIAVRRVRQPASTGGGVYLSNAEDATPSRAAMIVAEDCEGLALFLPEKGVGGLSVRRSRIRSISRTAAGTGPTAGPCLIADSIFDSTSFTGYAIKFDSVRNTWRGAITSAQSAINARLRSRIGDLVEIGTSGAPTQPDGYRDPAIYVV